LHGVHFTGLSAHHQWSATAAILGATSNFSKNGIRRAITKVRYRGLKKNTLQLKTLFALSNLWMARHQVLAAQG
jgi:IS5 family transposase